MPEVLSRRMRYYYRHLELERARARERSLKYYEEHKEECKARMKKWSLENKDKKRQADRKIYERTKEHRLEYQKDWYKKNRLKSFAYSATRRALKRTTGDGSVTSEAIQTMYVAQSGKCNLCGCELGISFHRDHIVPISKGGKHVISNIQLLCRHCNMKKGVN